MDSNSSFPKGKIQNIRGRCLILSGDDIDTDRIIPARFLKCVSFENLGEQVFADDRKELNGDHPFDQKINKGASILIVNQNFGCGSSREHAPQALMRWGIRAIIGQSFAEIFYGNCLALGIPCGTMSEHKIATLETIISENPMEEWKLDLNQETLNNHKTSLGLNYQPGALEMLRTGRWDATYQLTSNSDKLTQKLKNLPYLNQFNN